MLMGIGHDAGGSIGFTAHEHLRLQRCQDLMEQVRKEKAP